LAWVRIIPTARERQGGYGCGRGATRIARAASRSSIFIGIIALIAAAGLFFAGIVWFSLEITPRFWKLADEYLLSSRRDTEL